MPSFHDVRLMPVIEQGAVGGPEYNTVIFEMQSGYEQRIANWSMARHKWNIASGLRNGEELTELLAFFHARRGSLHGFRFKDWSDYTAGVDTGFVLEDSGSSGTWRLYKAYTSGGVTVHRRITRPVSGTVAFIGGETVDYSTGIVTGTSTATVWSGQFDVPVRFQSDAFQLTLDQIDIGNAELNVQEIRE